jgi:hypothetical protein
MEWPPEHSWWRSQLAAAQLSTASHGMSHLSSPVLARGMVASTDTNPHDPCGKRELAANAMNLAANTSAFLNARQHASQQASTAIPVTALCQ